MVENLKPLSGNRYRVTDIFHLVVELKGLKINAGDVLVSYDVNSLFTNVPLEDTIQI